MGLDMYLYASRLIDPASPEGVDILAEAGVTTAELEEMAGRDPYAYETSIYLPRWRFSDGSEAALSERIERAAGLLPLATEDSAGGHLSWRDGKIEVSITCAYWRKANAVHGWFVREVQDGVDECQLSSVHPEQLAKLRRDCERALEAYENGDVNGGGAIEQMTPTPGFFFGSTDVDEWWAGDMQNTIAQLDRIIKLAVEIGGVEFEYHSSW